MIIGITGKKRSGKDTFGEYLLLGLAARKFTVDITSFAAPIKSVAHYLFDFDIEQLNGSKKEVIDPYWGFSPRYVLQTLGTEYARNYLSPDIWVRIWEYKHAAMLQDKPELVIIVTDVRFENEAERILEKGGVLIKVERDTDTNEYGAHASETGLDNWALFNYTVDNNGSLADLSLAAEAVIDDLLTNMKTK